jgi:hypothetical protein
LSVQDFDYLTPYELALNIEAYLENKEADTKEKLTLAWLGEYYHRTRKLPSLREELKRISGKRKREPMTDQEMLAVVKRLNKQFKGKEIKGGE